MTEYKIASGHNNAAALTPVTAIAVSSGYAFQPPTARATLQPGIQRVRANGAWYESGFTLTTWRFSAFTDQQWQALYTNYANDATNDNAVTIRTRGRDGTFANYNARIVLPQRHELDYVPGGGFRDVEVRFVQLEAL